MKDPIGDRMKSLYEDRTRFSLPGKNYIIIRLDGKAFHTLTKQLKFKKPFDDNFIEMMNETTKYLCKNIQGVVLGYVQSDEISLVLQDFKNINTTAWFDGNVQKIASISASMATAVFNSLIRNYLTKAREENKKMFNCGMITKEIYIAETIKYQYFSGFAFFDSRCFTISKDFEVYNYLVWRNKDCIRNSILSLSQHTIGKHRTENKNCGELKEILKDKNKDWNLYDDCYKYGRIVLKKRKTFNEEKQISIDELRNKEYNNNSETYVRNVWEISSAFDFVKNIERKKEIMEIIQLKDSENLGE